MQAEIAELRRSLASLERRGAGLEGRAQALVRQYDQARRELAGIEDFLQLAPLAQARMEDLSRELLGELMEEVENNLTNAVREILGQERTVKSVRELKNGRLSISLQMENQGQVEDILQGQGGSVCNIVSVGLRLIGLAQLDPARHRLFLVLDEQDCWLRQDLVPQFVRLIAGMGLRLGVQVLYISHHGIDVFYGHAEKIFQLLPSRETGVKVGVLLDKSQTAGEPRQQESARIHVAP